MFQISATQKDLLHLKKSTIQRNYIAGKNADPDKEDDCNCTIDGKARRMSCSRSVIRFCVPEATVETAASTTASAKRLHVPAFCIWSCILQMCLCIADKKKPVLTLSSFTVLKVTAEGQPTWKFTARPTETSTEDAAWCGEFLLLELHAFAAPGFSSGRPDPAIETSLGQQAQEHATVNRLFLFPDCFWLVVGF